MFDRHSLLLDVKLPLWWKDKWQRPSILQIWHQDPATDGTDDSCGRFIRSRHIDQQLIDKVTRDYLIDWESGYQPYIDTPEKKGLSTIGIVTNLFLTAANNIYSAKGHSNPRRPAMKYVTANLAEIIIFAENSIDTIATHFNNNYGECDDTNEVRCKRLANIIIPFILRDLRPWWKHPRWHIHHWCFRVPVFNWNIGWNEHCEDGLID
jgi:hypothetical protein